MKYLFIHQNFPGQYLHLAQYLRSNKENTVVGIGQAENIQARGSIGGMATYGYPKPAGAGEHTHHYLKGLEAEVRRAQSVARSLIALKNKGFMPDVISVHPGWGEALFVRDVFPHTPIIMFCEFFFEAGQADLEFDPEFPYSADWAFSVRVRNGSQLISLPTANVCLCPTKWQLSRYPWFIQQRSQVIHDGINVDYMQPQGDASLTLQAVDTSGNSCILAPVVTCEKDQVLHDVPITLTRKDKVITYIARNLEPYRGFHCYMRALPAMQAKHPDAHFIIVGGDGVSYSPALPDGKSYKDKYLAENSDGLDFSRIHFVGKVPYPALKALFNISSAHIYLTYPFVLSWSVMEAMACEALVIASDTSPVKEVMEHGKNAVLVDFFSREQLVAAVDNALTYPEDFVHIRKQARKTIVENYSLLDCMQRNAQLLQDAADGKYPL